MLQWLPLLLKLESIDIGIITVTLPSALRYSTKLLLPPFSTTHHLQFHLSNT